MINIAICGASGRMGHFIADIIASRDDCKTVCGIDKFGDKYADFEIVRDVADMTEKPDVIIDFSNPALLHNLLGYCLSTGTPLVIGSTGYSDEQIAQIEVWCNSLPRKILGYKTPDELFEAELDKIYDMAA